MSSRTGAARFNWQHRQSIVDNMRMRTRLAKCTIPITLTCNAFYVRSDAFYTEFRVRRAEPTSCVSSYALYHLFLQGRANAVAMRHTLSGEGTDLT